MRFRTRVLPGHRVEVNTPQLSEGSAVDVLVVPTGQAEAGSQSRRDLSQMPIEQRRQILMSGADRLADYYQEDESERAEWQGGDVIE